MGSNGRVLTIKEASRVTGLSISTLRIHLKKGLIEGVKHSSKFGDTWYIKADSVKKISKVERVGLNPLTSSESTPSTSTPSTHINEANSAMAAKDEHLRDLRTQIKTYEELLSVFQQRISGLEKDRAGLEDKIKLLPAPPEMISYQIQNLATRIQELEAELQMERKRSWWQKIWIKPNKQHKNPIVFK